MTTGPVPRECAAHEMWNCRPCRWQSGLPIQEPTAPPPQYPEHEKLHTIAEKSHACGAFLTWLLERYRLGSFHEHSEACDEPGYRCDMNTDSLYPEHVNVQKLLAEFFEIDEDKLEKEKLAMLEELREQTTRRNDQ